MKNALTALSVMRANLLACVFLPVIRVESAGWCDGIEQGMSCGPKYARMQFNLTRLITMYIGSTLHLFVFFASSGSVETQELHLEPGERPRDSVWGAGLIEETITVDVLVAGGGSAGTSAALSAARNGATVVLANGRPVLGGNSGSEVRVAMVGACGGRTGSGNENQMRLECREGGIVEEYQLDNVRYHTPLRLHPAALDA